MIRILILSICCLAQTSLYDYKVASVDGGTIDFSKFRHKKILIVNISSQSRYKAQLKKLETLYERYKDSLVVVAFPSNSFGHEQGSNAAIRAYCRDSCGITFPVAAVNPVSGAVKQPVYEWLTSFSLNGQMNSEVAEDYQKFLVNESGMLIGVFGPAVDPLGEELLNAIHG